MDLFHQEFLQGSAINLIQKKYWQDILKKLSHKIRMKVQIKINWLNDFNTYYQESQGATSFHFQIDARQLTKQNLNITNIPRRIAIYLAEKNTDYSHRLIDNFFENAGRVMGSLKRIADW